MTAEWGPSPGRLELTPHRLHYADRARRFELPLVGLELVRHEESVELRSGSEVFVGSVPDLRELTLRLVLLRRFPPDAAAHVPHTLALATRVHDGVKGWLLVWPGGVLFGAKGWGAELLAALALAQMEEAGVGMLGGPEAREVLDAVAGLLPWAGEAVLLQMARSNTKWSWRREEIVTADDGEPEVLLSHRSGDDAQPRYQVGADVLALLGPAPV